jgi:hypothetical protein
MSPFELVYRMLARLVLPRAWHREHGAELVAAAADARGGILREIGALLATGVRLRARGASAPAPREGWIADGLRLGVLIILSVSFGLLQAPPYFNGERFSYEDGWKHLVIDGIWLAGIGLIGQRRTFAGLGAIASVATAGVLFAGHPLALDGGVFGGSPGDKPLALGMALCAVALIPKSHRRRSAEHGTLTWLTAPAVIAGFLYWTQARTTSCVRAIGDPRDPSLDVAAFNGCWFDYWHLFVGTPVVLMGVLATIALVRVRRNPRLAVSTAAALLAYSAGIVAWMDQEWATNSGAQLLTYASAAMAFLLCGAAALRVRSLPPSQTA